ncbi:hypothetical protein ACJIZ3_009102 [Penstemon smallii]|uniref:Uncharacterized protein n=1 Tax=Penstemon smallii TaxID=265156 RepID=A0ABD3TBL2_9LAMI
MPIPIAEKLIYATHMYFKGKLLLAEGKFPSRIDVFAVSRGRNGKASVNEHTAKLIVSILLFL